MSLYLKRHLIEFYVEVEDSSQYFFISAVFYSFFSFLFFSFPFLMSDIVHWTSDIDIGRRIEISDIRYRYRTSDRDIRHQI